MTSFVNVCDVKSAEKRYACLKIVNNKTKMNMTYISSHLCLWSLVVRKKEFRLKGFISLEDINLSRKNEITDLICLINHGIFRQACNIRAYALKW